MSNEMIMTDSEYFEKLVLSKSLRYPELRSELKIESKHFENDKHAALYEKLAGDSVFTKEDLLTDSIRVPETFGDYEFVRTITEFPTASKHGLLNDQSQVYQLYKQRTIKKMMAEYNKQPTDEKGLEISKIIQELDQFTLQDTDEKMDTLVNIRSDLYGETRQHVIPTGFEQLDNVISGFEMQQINIIAARPSIGKTAFALEMAKSLARGGAEVVFLSMESTEKNITQRLLASESKVGLSKFKSPVERMSTEEIEKIESSMQLYYEMPLKVVEHAELTPNAIRQIVNKMPEDKPCFIFIDYLQLMHPDHKHNSKYEEVSSISRELKKIVQATPNLTIIPLAQLNRGVESRNDKRPMMSDLRDSGGIEQDANMIMMLYRDDYYNPPDYIIKDAPSELDVIVTKNKDGGLGTVKLDFYKHIQKIY